jgi:preprotein translocase subunit Sec61beta
MDGRPRSIRRPFPLAIVSFLAGLALYVAAGLVQVNYFEGESRPFWLNGLFLVAVALVVAGLLVLVSGAVHAARGRR